MSAGNYVLADLGGAHYWLGGNFVPVERWEEKAEAIVCFDSWKAAAATVRRLGEQDCQLRVVLSPWVVPAEDGPQGFVLTNAAGDHYWLGDGWIGVEDWEFLAEEIVRFRSWAEASAEVRRQEAGGLRLKVVLSPWPCGGSDAERRRAPLRAVRHDGAAGRRPDWDASPPASGRGSGPCGGTGTGDSSPASGPGEAA